MLRIFFQILAFFFISPFNIWLHRLAGAKIGRNTAIHPGVLIIAKNVEIADWASIKFGTMISLRTLKLGRKSSIGFMTLIKGASDLIIGDACVIGAKNMINCERSITFEYYSGSGPGCYMYTHGSFLPVTEGYRAIFAPITIKEKVWIQMNCKIGPGVTIEKGSFLLPGTVLLENVEPMRIVAGDPGKLMKLPILQQPVQKKDMRKFGEEVINGYCQWSNEYNGTDWQVTKGSLRTKHRSRYYEITLGISGDIILITQEDARGKEMYFNLTDLSTDEARHPVKQKLEEYLRLYYGLIFLSNPVLNSLG